MEIGKYKVVNGTSFHTETDDKVCKILSDACGTGRRLRIFYGGDGKYWLEEHDVLGQIGRSTGQVKIPLMIARADSSGGPGILEHCIVRIQEGKNVLYNMPGFTIPAIDAVGLEVWVAGEKVAQFKTEKQAKRWAAFMRGERNSK
jgi:hypothetical protein